MLTVKEKFDRFCKHQIDDDEDFDLDSLFDEELKHIDEMLENSNTVNEFVDDVINEELERMYEDFLSDVISRDSYVACVESALADMPDEPLTEDMERSLILEGAEGYDCGEWIRAVFPKIGWLGKWIGAGLGALGLGLGALIVAGKDRLAMAKLKKYMNRLVELTDQGVHKKKPWYSFFTFGEAKRNLGEYNTGCFRTIQEAADRNMCVTVMVAAQKLGYFRKGGMMSIASGDAPQQGGGLDAFDVNIVSNLKILIER